jgi:hypothetical protein
MALPVGIVTEPDGRDRLSEAEELRLMARYMQEHLTTEKMAWRSKPDCIEILPEMVSLGAMLDRVDSIQPQRLQAVLGQDGSLQPAVFDLKRMGPHFAVVGPPLSGKTTALYNWVLSLTSRYSPQRVKLVLIDLQGKFAKYGGQHKLDELPHVVTVITEVEQVEELVAQLKTECEILATQAPGYEVFVLVDNFDDFSEEIEKNRDLPRELAGMARRYGGDGLHFIIAGTLDSGLSELRRRVQSSNYGIGLRTAQAVEALRVSRTPAAMREKELGLGRGFIVKSGQPTMIQVASPYEGLGLTATAGNLEDDEGKVAAALDLWVEQILAKYPDQRATWSDQTTAEVRTQTIAPQQSKKLMRMLSLLQQGMRKEMERLKEGNGSSELVTAKLVQMDFGRWNDEKTLMELLKELWKNEKIASGLPEEMVSSLFSVMDDESILQEIEASLAEEG